MKKRIFFLRRHFWPNNASLSNLPQREQEAGGGGCVLMQRLIRKLPILGELVAEKFLIKKTTTIFASVITVGLYIYILLCVPC